MVFGSPANLISSVPGTMHPGNSDLSSSSIPAGSQPSDTVIPLGSSSAAAPQRVEPQIPTRSSYRWQNIIGAAIIGTPLASYIAFAALALAENNDDWLIWGFVSTLPAAALGCCIAGCIKTHTENRTPPPADAA